MTPRLGVLDFNPIQYHCPLYQRLAGRGVIEIDVMFITDHGYRAELDQEFGVIISWDIDLLSGYSHHFLTTASSSPPGKMQQMRTLVSWLRNHDIVLLHGYSHPLMLASMAICRLLGVPYLIRGDSGPRGQAVGIRSHARELVARLAVSASAGGLSIGQLNEKFYRQHGAKRVTFAPYSVDDERFAKVPEVDRSQLLERWGLDSGRPIIMLCGKLYPGKRPLDVVAAAKLLPAPVTLLFVGDGALADDITASIGHGVGVVTGFVNQKELPVYYHAADILVLPSEAEKWGLVVNEAMAAGTLPVVSDKVGSAPDLVDGVGEIFPCADVQSLARALSRALARVTDCPDLREQVQQHAAAYSLTRTAVGFEEATKAVCHSS